MHWLHQLDSEKLLVFTLVLTRVSGLMTTAPIYGTSDVPGTARALFAVMLSALIMPTQWGATFSEPGNLLEYLVVLGGELLIGLCLGLGILVLLSGIQMAGELVSRIGGLNMADVFDPLTNDSVPLFSRLLTLVSTVAFVAIGGHRMLLAGLLDTFQTMPPGGVAATILQSAQATGGPGLLQSLADTFVMLVAQSFELGVRASVPIVTAILLATLVLGLIGRTMPQLNVLVIGFGLNAMITFGILSLSLGAMVMTFQNQIEPTLQSLFETLHIPIRSM